MQDVPQWIVQPHNQIGEVCADIVFEETPEKAVIEYVSRIAECLGKPSTLIVDIRRPSDDHWEPYGVSIVYHPAHADDQYSEGSTIFCKKANRQDFDRTG